MNDLVDDIDRSRIAWWLLGILLVGVLFLAIRQFLGAFVFGLFVYYAVRPVDRRIERRVDSSGLAAVATLLVVALPLVLLVGYLAVRLAIEIGAVSTDRVVALVQPYLDVSRLLANPRELVSMLRQRDALQVGSTLFGTVTAVLIRVSLALAFVYFLVRDDHRLAGWFRSEVGDERSAVYGYLSAVDRDLESVYLGNTLTALAIAILSVVVYNGFNALAPAGLTIPFPTALALLTGVASLVPLVVGKLVYVPIAAYLVAMAARGDPSFVYPVGFLVVSFLLLDLLPQTFVQPYVAGRTIHVGLTIFAYVLGTTLFGWYGLFLGPLLMVLMVQFVRIVFSELLHDDRITPHVTAAEGLGSSPRTRGAGSSDDG